MYRILQCTHVDELVAKDEIADCETLHSLMIDGGCDASAVTGRIFYYV